MKASSLAAPPLSSSGGALASSPGLRPLARAALALAVLGGLIAAVLAFDTYEARARTLALSLALGTALGIVFQRARFCFLCNARDFHRTRDPRGVLAILVALGAGLLGYQLVFGAWMPVVNPERLPPTAHIGPVSPALVLGALVFGLGMSVSGSCLSGHLYRLGEGSVGSIVALFGAAVGFGFGFMTWNGLYLAGLTTGPSLWLPHVLGYAGHLAAGLLALLLLAALVLWRAAPNATASPAEPPLREALRRVFVDRWPPVVGGLLVAGIGSFAYFRVAPLGVTAELGSLARTGATWAGLLPDTLFELDGLRGCVTVVKETLLSPNGLLVLGLIGGSFAAALAAGQFKPAWPTPRRAAQTFAGGVLMGWGAMTALGCTVGVLLSGIQAGALAGWVFLAACTAGVYLGFGLMREGR